LIEARKNENALAFARAFSFSRIASERILAFPHVAELARVWDFSTPNDPKCGNFG